MLDRLREWLNPDWPLWLEIVVGLGLFVVLAAVSALMTGWAVLRLPTDYFLGPHRPPLSDQRHPAIRVLARVGKNLLGVILLAGGIAMLFTPGQGVLTILLGLMLLDFPGKRRLEQWLVRRPSVLKGLNRLRARYGRPPLRVGTEYSAPSTEQKSAEY